MRAAHYGMPLMLAIIGGDPRRFAPFADLYRRALAQTGKAELPVGVHSHGFVGETDAQAREALFADYKRMRDRIGAERGWPPLTPADFAREIEHGSLYVGSPETVARKIAATVQGAGARPLRHEIQRRSAVAREDDAQHRAVRPQGHAAGAGHAGLTRAGRAGVPRHARPCAGHPRLGQTEGVDGRDKPGQAGLGVSAFSY